MLAHDSLLFFASHSFNHRLMAYLVRCAFGWWLSITRRSGKHVYSSPDISLLEPRLLIEQFSEKEIIMNSSHHLFNLADFVQNPPCNHPSSL